MSCRFKFYTDTKFRSTKIIPRSSTPAFDYSKQFTIKSVSHNFVNYLEHNALVVEVWGSQGSGQVRGCGCVGARMCGHGRVGGASCVLCERLSLVQEA